MMELLRDTVFHNKFAVDDREVLVSLGRYGITGTVSLDPWFLVQTVVSVGIIQALTVVAAVMAYYGIVVPSLSQKNAHRDSLQACLLGYGVILPMLLLTPYYLIQALDIRNCLLLINMVGSPVLATFRLLEVLHARRIPEFTKKRVGYFVLYFGVSLVAEYNDEERKPVRTTLKQLGQKATKILSLFFQATLLMSLMGEYDFKVFPQRPVSGVTDIFQFGNMFNGLLAASVVSVMLDLACTLGEFSVSIITGGLHFADSHNSPMTMSTSVSAFWGRRWNRLVGDSLRRGVFGPLRRLVPRSVAAVLTFLASGLAHEYMLFVLASSRSEHSANNLTQQPYRHRLGYQFGFFVWNGVLLILEELLRGNKVLVYVQNNFPRQLRTFLVMFLVLPITFLFTDEYDESGIFRDCAMSVPRIRYIESSPPLLPYPIDEMVMDGRNWTMKTFQSARWNGLGEDNQAAKWAFFSQPSAHSAFAYE